MRKVTITLASPVPALVYPDAGTGIINQNTPVNHWLGVNTVLGIRSTAVILEGEREE